MEQQVYRSEHPQLHLPTKQTITRERETGHTTFPRSGRIAIGLRHFEATVELLPDRKWVSGLGSIAYDLRVWKSPVSTRNDRPLRKPTRRLGTSTVTRRLKASDFCLLERGEVYRLKSFA